MTDESRLGCLLQDNIYEWIKRYDYHYSDEIFFYIIFVLQSLYLLGYLNRETHPFELYAYIYFTN